MPRALEILSKMRLAGLKPVSVWLVIADGVPQPKFWQWSDATVEIVLPHTHATLRADLRPLVGCDVILLADSASDIVRAVVAKLVELVSRLSVFVLDALPKKIGNEWVRGSGWREIGACHD